MQPIFQQVTLSPLAAIGEPGPLPAIFTGADPAGLLDLGWVPAEHGFTGQAFWPVIAEPVDFDPATEALTDEIGPVTLDAELQIATAIRGKRPLTAEELAALNPVPSAISDRQFAQQLAILGTISQAEAIAWAARGDLPAAMEAAVMALPEGDRFAARMLLSSATTYERAHPLVPPLGAILSYDDAELDTLWREAAAL